MTHSYAATLATIDGQRALIATRLPPPTASPALAAAWAKRHRANVTGRCGCGAQVVMPNRAARRAAAARGEAITVSMRHETGCPASDQALAALAAAALS